MHHLWIFRRPVFSTFDLIIGTPVTFLVFVRLFVFELQVRTEPTDWLTDGRTRPVLRPIGTPAHTKVTFWWVSVDVLWQMTERQQALDDVAQMADDWRTLATVIDRLLFTASFIVLLSIALWMIAKSLEQPDVKALGAIPAVFDHWLTDWRHKWSSSRSWSAQKRRLTS